ncbi:alcohol dehydrogenase catalytic domain-containing protein [Nonomuraea sp. NPDC050556]|uniref:alcohol dehydrogenase catalytic domain-containing protein n=1 Tax=Nonomuraea sp. NPDC050556 TaxID=3364369 RepID=UPI0037B02BE0
MRVLVTGATGTVGRQVMTDLRAAGVEVTGLSRSGPVRGDLADPASLRVEADAVFLVWPFATVDGLAEALDALPAGRIVYLSSAAARPHEVAAERLIAASGRPWTVLRPHVFAANARRWAAAIRAGGVVREPYGQASTAPVHEKDIAALAVRALLEDGHDGRTYELTGPDSLTQAEQVRIIGEVVGRPARWEEGSVEEARERMLAMGWPADEILAAQEALTLRPAPVLGAAVHSFRSWVASHAHLFLGVAGAARFHGYGEPVVYEEVPMPVGEVLVKVAATSFNASETALWSGALRDVLPLALPYTVGWDVSGTVVETGPGVTAWAVGDRVIGRVDAGGTAAEYVAVPADLLVAAPASIPLADAAALPVAGLTAWQAVVEHGRVRAGERVLINGAGGGVGGFAVQLARRAGAHVIATAGPRSAAAVRALGADEVVDYTTTPLPYGVDLVINLAPVSEEAAAELGTLGDRTVTVATPVPGGTHFVARNDTAQLARLVALVDAGSLVVDVSERLPMTSIGEVYDRALAGQVRGKIVLQSVLRNSGVPSPGRSSALSAAKMVRSS